MYCIRLRFTYFFIFLLGAVLLPAQQIVPLGNELLGSQEEEEYGLIHELSDNGQRLIVGCTYLDTAGNDRGVVVYQQEVQGTWTRLGDPIAPSSAEEQTGKAVAISDDGSRIAVFSEDNTGGFVTVYAFNQVEENWQLLGDTLANDTQRSYGDGLTFSGDGNTVAFWGVSETNAAADAYVFRWNGTQSQWVGDSLSFSDTFAPTSFALSDDGSVLAAANIFYTDNDRGEVRVYQRNDETWQQRGGAWQGASSGAVIGSGGLSLSASGDTLLIASPFEQMPGTDISGTINTYAWTGNSWGQLGTTLAYAEARPSLGADADLSEDGRLIVAGAFGSTIDGLVTGQLTAYQWQQDAWIPIGEPLLGPGGSFFAYKLSAAADMQTVAVADYGFSTPAQNTGRIRFYRLDGLTTSLQPFSRSLSATARIFPNPTARLVNVQYELPTAMPLTISLHASDGQMLRQVASYSQQAPGMHYKSIPVNELPAGMYFLRLQSQGKMLTRPLLIK